MNEKNANSIMPILFLGHGSPMNAIEDNDFTQSLKKLGETLPQPSSILVVSAHWETQGTWLTGMDKPKTIHDFYGFPKALFDVEYPAPGAPDLAQEISTKLIDFNVNIDFDQWGLDHGTWSVLKHMYPKADIPIVQLSLDKSKAMEFHFELGQHLKFLREQNVMIIGSGNIVHNLRELSWDQEAKPHAWAIEFDEWVKKQLLTGDYKSLLSSVLDSAPAKLSIPTLEHYLPLLYVLGASNSTDTLKFDYEGIQNSSISMRSLRFFKD